MDTETTSIHWVVEEQKSKMANFLIGLAQDINHLLKIVFITDSAERASLWTSYLRIDHPDHSFIVVYPTPFYLEKMEQLFLNIRGEVLVAFDYFEIFNLSRRNLIFWEMAFRIATDFVNSIILFSSGNKILDMQMVRDILEESYCDIKIYGMDKVLPRREEKRKIRKISPMIDWRNWLLIEEMISHQVIVVLDDEKKLGLVSKAIGQNNKTIILSRSLEVLKDLEKQSTKLTFFIDKKVLMNLDTFLDLFPSIHLARIFVIEENFNYLHHFYYFIKMKILSSFLLSK